ncbi:MAG: hypothetical protein FVQ79_03420 [Planctomycetes bacterium]|nr:hypothetical protein [Planctomycetota bacterium]
MEDEKKEIDEKHKELLTKAYGNDEEEWKYAQDKIQQINTDLELREQASLVFNGVAYSTAYEYNQVKGINYSPPRNIEDDREVSLGIVHEKIVAFAAIFLKYVFKYRIRCYDSKGKLVRGLGKIYELGIEFSRKREQFLHIIGLVFWEVFTQGNAFVLEDWEVMNRKKIKAYLKKEGEEKKIVNPDTMDYTYEFLDELTYEDGDEVQLRRAISRVLDGRQVIFGNPEIENIQEQPRITIEEEMSKGDAHAMFGTLKRWDHIPKEATNIEIMTGEKLTLFDVKRLKKPEETFIIHRVLDKEHNRFNIFINGLMIFSRKTPLTLFYPRNNYPISNVPAERLRGSIYARSVPAKTKFNADFVDWALKMLANKFEQGIDPAILSKGKYTLSRNMFRGGQVTHGVSSQDFERADPENKGITQPEFSFVGLLKEIIEAQTINRITAGEGTGADTLGQEQLLESNQRDKLGYLLDGLMLGFLQMAERRCETIESKYTIKQKETIVDGKKINVYQNFSVSVSGTENDVEFNDEVGGENYDVEGTRNELFKKSFEDKKAGFSTEYYLANPNHIREGRYFFDVEIIPERIKDTNIQLAIMWEDFANRLKIFGTVVNIDAMKKEYLETSGKPDDTFTTQLYQKLDQEQVINSQRVPAGSERKKEVNVR